MTDTLINPNNKEQEQEINIKEFFKTQKQLITSMQINFQKHTAATPQSSELLG